MKKYLILLLFILLYCGCKKETYDLEGTWEIIDGQDAFNLPYIEIFFEKCKDKNCPMAFITPSLYKNGTYEYDRETGDLTISIFGNFAYSINNSINGKIMNFNYTVKFYDESHIKLKGTNSESSYVVLARK